MRSWTTPRSAGASHRRFLFDLLRAALVLIGSLTPLAATALSADHLTTNGRTNPLGIGADEISFAWAIATETRGVVQTAYQLRVGTTAGADDVWDSGGSLRIARSTFRWRRPSGWRPRCAIFGR